jgi:hypothetical protein
VDLTDHAQIHDAAAEFGVLDRTESINHLGFSDRHEGSFSQAISRIDRSSNDRAETPIER